MYRPSLGSADFVKLYTLSIYPSVAPAVPRKGLGSADFVKLYTLSIYPSVHNELREPFSRYGLYVVIIAHALSVLSIKVNFSIKKAVGRWPIDHKLFTFSRDFEADGLRQF